MSSALPLSAPAAVKPHWFETAKTYRFPLTLAFLMIFPWLMPYEALAVNILILGLYALGFNLVFGYTGLLSFCHAAFLGTGAYACGWFGAILIGTSVATLTAAIMGVLAIRTRGIYFAMVTLALSMCVYYALYQMQWLTGGENGLRGVNIKTISVLGFELPFINPTVKYYVVLAFVATAIWLFSRLLASPFGAVLEAIRENEERAKACGYDVARTKLLVFIISGAICGLAGALNALHLSIVPIETLHYITSGQAVMMALLGGMGTFFGPFIGAATFLLIQDVASTITSHWQLFVGIIFIGFVLFFPKGIWGSILHWLEER
jgi:branched-chain amino acid transport system permease protein